jgi:hypothetical protein
MAVANKLLDKGNRILKDSNNLRKRRKEAIKPKNRCKRKYIFETETFLTLSIIIVNIYIKLKFTNHFS